MILDYDYSKEKKQMSISYIGEGGNKEILHFDNLSKFQTYYHTPNGRFIDERGARCDIKFTQKPTNFDLHEFIDNLNPEIQQKLNGKIFPKLYTFDIETRMKPGPHGEVGLGPFTDPTVADEPIHTISLVSPNLNCVVAGDKPLTDSEIEWIRDQFYAYLDSIPFYKTLNIPKPEFKYLYFDSEEKMLRWFMKITSKVPILAGWNSIGYDWNYITHRILNYYGNISVKDASCTGMTRNQNYKDKRGRDTQLKHPVHTLVLDMMDVIENEDTQVLPIKESMNLDYIAHESLGANKIEYTENLEVLYNTNFAKYVFYNLIDSILVQLIDKKFKTMDHIYMYSLYAKERIGKCFSKIALTQALILRNYRNRGIKVVYDYKESPERGRLIGAYVKTPIPGKHQMVVCNDFASLYPSTMRTTNVSFDNYVGHFYKDELLEPYKKNPVQYIVVCAKVYTNAGTFEKPELGEFVAEFLDEEALAPYRADKNYFVTVNGHVYKNDQDYTLKRIMSELYDARNFSKYLSKDLDAMVISDIDHIARGVDAELHTYNENMISTMKDMGYDITCGEDLKKMKLEDMLEFERKLKVEIVYHSNLEQAIKLMMNSVYGGTSHPSFYWFNMDLANDITGESRNLTHMMEDHLGEYWKTAWQTDKNLAELRNKLGLTLKPDAEISNIITKSKEKSLATIVYGDSVDGSSIIRCRYQDDEFKTSISELYEYCRTQFGVVGIDDQGSEHIKCPFQLANVVNGEFVWSDVKDLIAHKVYKQKWQIKTKSGKVINITSDHSLVVLRDGKQVVIKPTELKKTDRLIVIEE